VLVVLVLVLVVLVLVVLVLVVGVVGVVVVVGVNGGGGFGGGRRRRRCRRRRRRRLDWNTIPRIQYSSNLFLEPPRQAHHLNYSYLPCTCTGKRSGGGAFVCAYRHGKHVL
jgi:hypothetical protein